jgi:hypothetical protein
MRLLRQVVDGDPHGDPVGGGGVLEEFFHVALQVSDSSPGHKSSNALNPGCIPQLVAISPKPGSSGAGSTIAKR